MIYIMGQHPLFMQWNYTIYVESNYSIMHDNFFISSCCAVISRTLCRSKFFMLWVEIISAVADVALEFVLVVFGAFSVELLASTLLTVKFFFTAVVSTLVECSTTLVECSTTLDR